MNESTVKELDEEQVESRF